MPLGLGRIVAELSQNVRHAFVSAQTQSAIATRVSRNEWNAAHNVPDVEFGAMPGLVLDPVDAGTTEAFGTIAGENRFQKRLAYATAIRVQACVIEAAVGAALVLQYTTDLTGATGWTTTGASVALTSNGNVVSSWVTVPAGAQGANGVLLRWVITA